MIARQCSELVSYRFDSRTCSMRSHIALAGRPAQVKEKVREYIAAGIDELTIIPCGRSKQTTLESFAREVMEKI